MKRIEAAKTPGSDETFSVYNSDQLRRQARWMRDELDPQVARDGPDALHSDEILKLDEFLRRLMSSNVHVEDIRYSRIHLAILDITGRATRWPKRLVDRCDALREMWEAAYGPLKGVGTLLYEPGGRLHGLCKPEDVSREKLMVKWLKTPLGVKLSPAVARRVGDLGFKPGDWWINPMFAFRDGIIDSGEPDGGITADADGAYAVLMTGNEEVDGPTPDSFTYRAPNTDRGRYRLASGAPDSRQPVRILRSHSLHSFYSPRGGLRYDGLHKVISWSIKLDPKTKATVYEICFRRLPSEHSMEAVLRRPWSDELEDYKEYKREHHLARDRNGDVARVRLAKVPTFNVSMDGAWDVAEDAFA